MCEVIFISSCPEPWLERWPHFQGKPAWSGWRRGNYRQVALEKSAPSQVKAVGQTSLPLGALGRYKTFFFEKVIFSASQIFFPLDLSRSKRIWLFDSSSWSSSSSTGFFPFEFLTDSRNRAHSSSSQSWYFHQDLTPSRPNLRKALLRSFSISSPKSFGELSWFFPKPPFSAKNSLNHFLSRLWCISAKCSISLLNDRLSFAPISGERLKKDRASVLNISSDAFSFLRLSLNQLRVSLFEGTRCSFAGRSILTDKWQSQMEKSQGTHSHFLKNFNPCVSRS